MSKTISAGIVTAYGAAVRGGYTGTYAQFCEALGQLAQVLEDFEGFSVEVTTLEAGSPATADYHDGVLYLGIPQGQKGDPGAKGDPGSKGDPGAKGDPGNNGVSPEVTITTITGGHRVTITDADHPTGQSFDVMDGEDGASDAGEIEFDDSETYPAGSIGAEVSQQKNAISEKAPVIINTASGDIARFVDGADGMQIRKIVGTIVPVQSGTGDPSPTNVRSISGYTQAKIKASNGNILDLSTATPYPSETDATVAYNAENDSLYTVGISPYSGASVKIPVEPNTQYIVSAYYTSGNATSLAVIGQNGSTLIANSGEAYGNRRITLSFNSGANSYIFVRFYASRQSGNRGLTVSEAALMKGATAIYTPITTLHINWQTEAGTIYGGTVTLNEDGSVDVVVTKAGKTISQLSGSPYISNGLLRWDSINSLFPGFIYSGNHNAPNAIATMLRGVGDTPIVATDAYRGTFAFGLTIFWISDNTCATAEAYREKYADCLIVWDLKAANQQSIHLDNVGSLSTYLGANNVWIDTGAITECDYPADTKLYIDGLTAPDEDMIADANIASGKYFVVNNQLYLSTAAIAAGASIVPGTNCTATNLAEALNALNT